MENFPPYEYQWNYKLYSSNHVKNTKKRKLSFSDQMLLDLFLRM